MESNELKEYNNYMEYRANKHKLEELSKDIIQYMAGINVPDIDNKKQEFYILLNKVRQFEGKHPKSVN